jgi:hypothetical protein
MTDNIYTGLITSEHNQRAKFSAMVTLLTQPSVDAQQQFLSLASLFDLDAAVGDQLDKLGAWVGAARTVALDSGSVVLPDANYRTLLRAVIAANHWDGTVPGAYTVFNLMFASEGITLLLQDNQDMTMTPVFIIPGVLSPLDAALIKNGLIVMRPAGVRITGYFRAVSTPVMGMGIENSFISGFGVGYWIQPL